MLEQRLGFSVEFAPARMDKHRARTPVSRYAPPGGGVCLDPQHVETSLTGRRAAVGPCARSHFPWEHGHVFRAVVNGAVIFWERGVPCVAVQAVRCPHLYGGA